MNYNPTRSWNIALTNIELPNSNGHFLYCKVPLEEGVTTSEILASEDHIDPLRDDGFVIYKMGYVHPVVNGSREVSMLWGNSRKPVTSFDVYIDFLDLTPFVYNCPAALKFTSQTSESTAATLSVALNTNMTQFQKLTVTPTAIGLVILKGLLL